MLSTWDIYSYVWRWSLFSHYFWGLNRASCFISTVNFITPKFKFNASWCIFRWCHCIFSHWFYNAMIIQLLRIILSLIRRSLIEESTQKLFASPHLNNPSSQMVIFIYKIKLLIPALLRTTSIKLCLRQFLMHYRNFWVHQMLTL